MKNSIIAKSVALGSLLIASLGAQAQDNWSNSSGDTWKNSSGECWRNSSWTPATATKGCDGALVEAPKIVEAPKVAPVVKPPEAKAPVIIKKVRISGDTLFDFNKAILKPVGKLQLDVLVERLNQLNLEVVLAVGHTDSKGTEAYNMDLARKRAQAVKDHLVMRGVDSKLLVIESKGELAPVASNATAAGRAENRRVEIEAIGVYKNGVNSEIQKN